MTTRSDTDAVLSNNGCAAMERDPCSNRHQPQIIARRMQRIGPVDDRAGFGPTGSGAGRPGHGLDTSGEMLAIGYARARLSEVVHFEVRGHAEKDFSSNFATASAFGSVATAAALLVLIADWQPRFLVVSVLCGMIALFALIDVGRNRWHTSYAFKLETVDGGLFDFGTASEAGAERLHVALSARLGRARDEI